MRRFIATLIVLFAAGVMMSAQYVFSGSSGAYLGYIYEDGMSDDGVRYIISDMQVIDKYAFSLCKFVPEEGEPWYGVAIESKEYIPRNGLLVFITESSDELQTFVLGQKVSDKGVATKLSVGFNPVLFFGSNNLGGMLMSLYPKTITSEVSYSVYDMSAQDLEQLLTTTFKEVRISSRSTYKTLKGNYLKTLSKWMIKAKEDVDARSQRSRNSILEDIN